MNNARRKEIDEVIGQLEQLKERIEQLLEDEEKAMENMPENLQYNSERWEIAEVAVEALEGACYSIEEVIGHFEGARDN